MPFEKGKSGNPNGRPKNVFTIKNAIGKLADEIPEGEDKTRADLLSELAWGKALGGEKWFMQYVTEHKEGKPHQSTSVDSDTINSPYELYKQRLLEKED